MNTTLTPYLAAWGAVLSTVTFLWNFWKWYRENPRIVATVEALENLESDGFSAIHYEIRNRGGKPTTIEKIMLVKYQDGIRGLLREYKTCANESVASRDTVRLPALLKPGEVWQGSTVIAEERSPMQMDKSSLIVAGRLFYKVKCAHTDTLLSGKVRPERFKTRL